MKKLRIIAYIIFCSYFYPSSAFHSLVYAQDSLGESIDCTDVSVNYSDDGTLTREERLRLMDKAFFESLNKFERCLAARKMAVAGGAAGGGGDGAGGGSGDTGGGTGTGESGESVASSSMSGTDAPKEISSVENMEAGDSGAVETNQGMDATGKRTGNNKTSLNGKPPEDIPPADNDDALAAQIRYAAENETDPVKKEQLWNEYRKYKGLPLKK